MRSAQRFPVLPLLFVMVLAFGAVGVLAVDAAGASDHEDCGTSEHPSGKDRCEEHGGSGTQGNATADPDDDGRGPDRSNGGVDQDGGSGGVNQRDQDGNNGCGNDQDFEDDNEGLCQGRQDSAGTGGGDGSTQGPQGPKDDTGPQDDSGPQDPQGPGDGNGPKNPQGPKDPQGPGDGNGPKNPQGPGDGSGPKNPQGPQGPGGSTGNGEGLGDLVTAPTTGGEVSGGALPGSGGAVPAAPGAPPAGSPGNPPQGGALSGIDSAGQVFSPTPQLDQAIGLAAGAPAPAGSAGGSGQLAPAAPVEQLPATGANVVGGLLTALTSLGIGVAALRRGRLPAEPEPWLCA